MIMDVVAPLEEEVEEAALVLGALHWRVVASIYRSSEELQALVYFPDGHPISP